MTTRRSTPPPGAGFAYDVARQALEEQLGRIEALDTKAGVLIAIEGVLAGLLLGGNRVLLDAPPGLATGVIAGVVGSLMLALVAFASRRYKVAPRSEAVIKLMGAPEAWLRWRFLGNLERARGDNAKTLARKSRLLTTSLATLIATIVVLGGYFIYDVWTSPVRSM